MMSVFFIFLSIHGIYIAKSPPVEFSRQSDSTGIEIVYVNKSEHVRHQIAVYINKSLYNSNLRELNGFIPLPDSLQQTDRIKVIVFSNKKIKHKSYRFKYEHVQDVTIKIIKKRNRLFSRKGKMEGCPKYFW